MKNISAITSILIFATNALAIDNSKIEYMALPFGQDSAVKLMSTWQRRMHQQNIFNNQILSPTGRKLHLITGKIPYVYTDSRIEIDSIGADSCLISSNFQTYLSSEAAQIVIPHLQGTVRQAANQAISNGRDLQSKSLNLYIGLSALNFGVGGMYLKNANFTSRPNSFLIIANGLGDAGAVAMMFSDKHSYRVLGYSMFAVYKALALLQIPSLNLHNKFDETGYQFSF